jgi:hypothetical protein
LKQKETLGIGRLWIHNIWMLNEGSIPPRQERFMAVLSRVSLLPPAHSSLEAYGQLSEELNAAEDEVFGRDYWEPPRTFLDGNRTPRIYPIHTESFHPVVGFNGVTLMIAKKEYVMISRHGAMEVQSKIPDDLYGDLLHFSERNDHILWQKNDAYGDGVWHEKNRT